MQPVNGKVDLGSDLERGIALVEQAERVGQLAKRQRPSCLARLRRRCGNAHWDLSEQQSPAVHNPQSRCRHRTSNRAIDLTDSVRSAFEPARMLASNAPPALIPSRFDGAVARFG